MGVIQVEEIGPENISPGDTIWAHDDGDWLEVARITPLRAGRVAYRRDGSEATYVDGKPLLRRVS